MPETEAMLGMDWSHRRKSALMLSTRLNQMTWQDTRRNSALAAVHWFWSRLYMDCLFIASTVYGPSRAGHYWEDRLRQRHTWCLRPFCIIMPCTSRTKTCGPSPTSGQGRGSTDGFFSPEGVCKSFPRLHFNEPHCLTSDRCLNSMMIGTCGGTRSSTCTSAVEQRVFHLPSRSRIPKSDAKTPTSHNMPQVT